MRKIYKVTSFLLIITIIFGIIPFKNAQAASKEKGATTSGWDVFVDANGDVNVITNDKKKTSSIYYRTIGFTISRGKFNPSMKKLHSGASTDNFTVLIDSMAVDTSTEGGREINAFKLPYATMKSLIGGCSGEWLQEIEDAEKFGGTAYVRFDCIMIIYHGTATDGYRYMNDPPRGPNDDEATDLNPNEIQGAEAWSAGASTGFIPVRSSARTNISN
ncbi:MAG: hypothetical protein K6E34_13675 [Lachnospiraceae bacterium]|nr:hypothetical protein [Lachnospiraceae bacterium]